MSTSRIRAAALLAATVVSITASAACTGPDAPLGPLSGSGSTAPVFDEPVTLPELRISDPVWGSDDVQVKTLGQIAFLRDTAIVGGREDPMSSKGWIQAVDAASGDVRWTLERSAPLPDSAATLWETGFTLVDDGAAGLVVVEYFLDGCSAPAADCPADGREPEQGVAAVSIADGSVRWTATTLSAAERQRAAADAGVDVDLSTVMMTGDATVGAAGVVLVVLGPREAVHGVQVVEPGAVGTIALDPLTGQQRWRVDGVVGRWFVGDAVVGTAQPTGAVGSTTRGSGPPVVIEAATGKRRWDRVAEFAEAVTHPPSSGLVPVHRLDGGRFQTGVLLSLADGSMVAQYSKTSGVRTAPSADLVAWLPVDADALSSFAPGDAEPRVAANPAPDGYRGPQLVHGGYVLVVKTDSAARTETTLALDRSGAVLSDPIPGGVRAMTDDWLVTVGRSTSPMGGYDSFAVRGLDLTP